MKKDTKSNLAANEKQKNNTKRKTTNVIFYVCSSFILFLSLALLVFLICNISYWKSNFVVVVGLATGLFALATTLGSLFSYINSQRSYKGEISEKQIANAESLIREFNEKYLEDSIQLFRIIEVTNRNVGLLFEFGSSLEIQDSKIDLFNTSVGEEEFKNKLYISACSRFFTLGILSEKMTGFCELVLKNKAKYEPLKNRGRTEIESIFRFKRIRILNFLECLAISYINSTADREMLLSQFSSFIQLFISQFYILIYLDEGLGCYPCLKVLANELLTKA